MTVPQSVHAKNNIRGLKQGAGIITFGECEKSGAFVGDNGADGIFTREPYRYFGINCSGNYFRHISIKDIAGTEPCRLEIPPCVFADP